MHPAETFELVLGMLGAILVLYWLAERLRWPPSIALLIGGGALAFIPGMPLVTLDPELVLVLFLPAPVGAGPSPSSPKTSRHQCSRTIICVELHAAG